MKTLLLLLLLGVVGLLLAAAEPHGDRWVDPSFHPRGVEILSQGALWLRVADDGDAAAPLGAARHDDCAPLTPAVLFVQRPPASPQRFFDALAAALKATRRATVLAPASPLMPAVRRAYFARLQQTRSRFAYFAPSTARYRGETAALAVTQIEHPVTAAARVFAAATGGLDPAALAACAARPRAEWPRCGLPAKAPGRLSVVRMRHHFAVVAIAEREADSLALLEQRLPSYAIGLRAALQAAAGGGHPAAPRVAPAARAALLAGLAEEMRVYGFADARLTAQLGRCDRELIERRWRSARWHEPEARLRVGLAEDPAGPPNPAHRAPLAASLAGRPLDPPLTVFVHIPKCAGSFMTSLLEDLQRRRGSFTLVDSEIFFKRPSHKIPTPRELSDLWTRMAFEPGLRSVYSMHVRFMPYTGATFFTVLREPAAMAVSHFHYKRATTPGWTEAHGGEEMTVDACVARPVEQWSACGVKKGSPGELVRWIAGFHNLEGAALLRAAEANVDQYFGVVGILERMDDTLWALENRFPHLFAGARASLAAHRRRRLVNSNANKHPMPSAATLERLRAVLDIDVQFYHDASKRLDEELRGWPAKPAV